MGFLRTPKIHAQENNWSVILHPLKGELEKKRVAEKISELFRLSFEEARELVQSTPLILLDQLSRETAVQTQTALQETRSEITLTNDFIVKRRCYRAVWPEPPDLSFLNSAPPVIPSVPSPPAVSEKPVEETVREARPPAPERDLPEISWEERYAGLKEESQETKTIYEEKILAREKELEQLKAQFKEALRAQERVAHLERQTQEALRRLTELETAKEVLERGLKEKTEEASLWREKYLTQAQQSERLESLYEEERKRREKAEESWRQASGIADSTSRDLESQMKETDRWRKRVQELEEGHRRLEEELAQAATEHDTTLRKLREENQQIALQLDSAQRQVREYFQQMEQQELIEKRTRLANELAEKEARLREFTLESDRLRQEIQDRELQAQALASERGDLEREILEVKQAQRHLLEQSKMKEKGNKLKRPGKDLGPDTTSG